MVSAHDQLAVYEEGRGDGHPEADALVHVQLIYGLVVDHDGFDGKHSAGVLFPRRGGFHGQDLPC